MLRDTILEWTENLPAVADAASIFRVAHVIDAHAWAPMAYKTMEALVGSKPTGYVDVCRGLPSCRPPLPVTFVEVPWANVRAGILFRETTGAAIEEMLGRRTERGFWEKSTGPIYSAEAWALWPNESVPHTLVRLSPLRTFTFDADGIIQRDTYHRLDGAVSIYPRSKNPLIWLQDGVDPERSAKTLQNMHEATQAMAFAALFALALMHAPGTVVREVLPSVRLNRARSKRNRSPLLRYHVLDLAVPKPVSSRQELPSDQAESEPPALHIVRGHYLRYHGIRKWRGAFWRGDPAYGVIIKDYRLAVAHPATAETALATPAEEN